MVWRSNANTKSWIGPAKVIQQDNSNTVFCQHMGNLLRAAPEHVRPVTAVEATMIPEQMPIQFPQVNTNSQSETSSSINAEIPRASDNPTVVSDHGRQPSQISQDQPDQEPEKKSSESLNFPQDTTTSSNLQITPTSHDQVENQAIPESQDIPAHEVPVPDLETDDELVYDLLTCIDVGDQSHLQGDKNLAWRFEVSFDDGLLPEPKTEQDVEASVFLATAAKKQRTEVKLSQLTEAERQEFEQAKPPR